MSAVLLPVQTAQVAGEGHLRFSRLGEGAPLILLHGYPDNLQMWSGVAPLLARGREVIALDWPGMGGSENWKGGGTPQSMAKRLSIILDHFGFERADLCGIDMGGQPVLVMAAAEPERVRSVVVMNSLLFGDEGTSWEISLLRRFRLNRVLLRHFPRLVFDRAVRTSTASKKALPAEILQDFWEHFRTPEVREYIIRMCAGYQGQLHRLPELYGKISQPLLALWGGADKHFPPRHGERLAAVLPHAKLCILEGVEHWAPLERAELVAQEIDSFLRSVANQR